MRARRLINNVSNAGLANLAGAAGYGFANAGKQIASLGRDMTANDKYDEQQKIIAAEKVAAEKEKMASRDATRGLNYAQNPEMVAKFNKQYGITGDLAKNPNAPTLANANLGRVNLGKPAEHKKNVINLSGRAYDIDTQEFLTDAPAPEIKFAKAAADGGFDVITLKDGTQLRGTQKSKADYNAKKRDTKADIPAGMTKSKQGYSPEMVAKLKNADAYFKDANGVEYSDYSKYKKKYPSIKDKIIEPKAQSEEIIEVPTSPKEEIPKGVVKLDDRSFLDGSMAGRNSKALASLFTNDQAGRKQEAIQRIKKQISLSTGAQKASLLKTLKQLEK